MPTDVEITDPKLSVFVPVPRASEAGVCAVCHGATLTRNDGSHWPICWNCRSLPAGGIRLVVPVSLVHTSESQLYASLRDYKKEPLPGRIRAEHALLLAATLQRFLRIHRSCIEDSAGAEWDAVQVVPSTRDRPGTHPLEDVLGMTGLGQDVAHFLEPTGEAIGHTQPNPGAFSVSAAARGRQVLLVDNTFTSGARVQSASAALNHAGARVIAAVPIGRVIDTELSTKLAFWQRQRAIPFDFNACCLQA